MRSIFRLDLIILNMLTSAAVTLLVLGAAWTSFGGGSLSGGFERGTFAAWPALEVADMTVEDIVSQANPAVVSITSVREGAVDSADLWLFRWFGDEMVEPTTRTVGGGSGFIVSSDGRIVTNRHVVEGASELNVTLHDGKSYPARQVHLHDRLDLAVIEIDAPKELQSLSFTKEPIRVGQSVVAIGNALSEFSNSVSVGVVSGVGRSIIAADNFGREEKLNHLIQTDAAINPGNSGGPLLNRQGEVVGVNVAIAEGYENIGFALPADLAVRALSVYVD